MALFANEAFGRCQNVPQFSFVQVVAMSCQTQIVETVENVPTKEGLNVHLEAAALFHLDPEHAVEMYKRVGADYVNTVCVASAAKSRWDSHGKKLHGPPFFLTINLLHLPPGGGVWHVAMGCCSRLQLAAPIG